MISEVIKFWKLIHASYLENEIQKPMYLYLSGVIAALVGLYFYVVWSGIVGLSILFGALTGSQIGIPVTTIQAIGIVVIIRYSLLGGIDSVARRTPDNITERLKLIEDKLNSLHRLAFEMDDEPIQPKEEVKIVKKSKGRKK